MKITVNNTPLEIHTGAKVKDVILKYYPQHGKKCPKLIPPVEDRYGNEVAPDGELTEGNIFVIKTKNESGSAFRTVIFALLTIGLLSTSALYAPTCLLPIQ